MMSAPHLINTPPRSYRDYLAKRGYEPIHITRANKRGGHLVLGNSTQPVSVVPGRKGSFRGHLA